MTTRATVRLSTHCDNACRFCAQSGIEAVDADDWAARLQTARAGGVDEVTFVGGEPVLAASLVPAIEQARTLGFTAIGVQSNGRGLADGARVDALRSAGLTDVHLSIHGAREAVHDYHVGREGAFAATTRALAELRSRGVLVVVTTVLTRSNARVLGELPTWLDHHGVRAWCVLVPRVVGGAARELDRVVPRLGLAMPFALHALDRARRFGIQVGVIGAPSCVLGPWASAVVPEPEGPRAFGEPCTTCAARASCTGVDARYLQRFGGDELRPRAEVVGAVRPMESALQRMFVGVGEAHDVDVVVHESVRAARRKLPVLNKAQPGVDETRGVVQTAEGLFPRLGEE